MKPNAGAAAGDTSSNAGPSPGPRAPTSAAPAVFVLLGCALGASWVAAQWLAAHYGYAAWLGLPVVSSSPRAVALWRLTAVAAAGVSAFVALRVRRTRAWGPALAVGCALAAAAAVVAARGPLYGPLQGMTWAVRLHALAPPAPPRPGTAARGDDPPLPPGAVRAASGRVYYPLAADQRATLAAVSPATATKAVAAVQGYMQTFAGSFVVLLAAVLVARPPRRRRVPSASHGSAAWGDPSDLRATLVPGPVLGNATGEPLGLLLGRPLTEGKPIADSRPLTEPALDIVRFLGEGHLVTFGPNRTGKGVSVIVPNLLYYPGSVVVSDPKGENYTLTQRRRRTAGQHVWALDPFGITHAARNQAGELATLNPLDIVDAFSDDALDDAALLADMLSVPGEGGSGTGGEQHFEDEARALLSTLILYVAATEAPGKRRSLPRVRELVTLPPEDFAKLLTTMRACGDASAVTRLGHAGTLIARGAARLQSKAEKERSGVISTAQRYTHFLDSRRMVGVLERTTVPLELLREGRLSLYLVLPTGRLGTYRPWMRLMLGVCLRTMLHQAAGQALGAPHAKPRALFALDEFANLKRLAPVEDAFTIAAGYGITFWLFLQDLPQLKREYRHSWNSFLANADVLQAFGTNDLETAKLLSELTGDATILVEGENLSASVSHGNQRSRQEGSSQSVSEKGRRLLTPDEVRRLPPEEALVFLRGRSPLRVRKLHYGRDAAFAGMYDRPAVDEAPQAPPAASADGGEPGGASNDADAGGDGHPPEGAVAAATGAATGAA